MDNLRVLPSGKRWEAVRTIRVTERFASLIKNEVERSQLEHQIIEERARLEPGQLYKWENALESPQANKFYQTVLFLGPTAYGNAASLWTDIQFELAEILAETPKTILKLQSNLHNFEALGAINRFAA